MVNARVKQYAIVAGIFLLGAGAGAGAMYAVGQRRIVAMLQEDRPEANEMRRFLALSRELDLDEEQRAKLRTIFEQHREENRRLMRAVFEECGGDLGAQRAQVDAEIRKLLTPAQRERFDELSAKRRRRFPFGKRP